MAVLNKHDIYFSVLLLERLAQKLPELVFLISLKIFCVFRTSGGDRRNNQTKSNQELKKAKIGVVLGSGSSLNLLGKIDLDRLQHCFVVTINDSALHPNIYPDAYSLEVFKTRQHTDLVFRHVDAVVAGGSPAEVWLKLPPTFQKVWLLRHYPNLLRRSRILIPVQMSTKNEERLARDLDSYFRIFPKALMPFFPANSFSSVFRMTVCIHALGARKINFSGVDLNHSRYFWEDMKIGKLLLRARKSYQKDVGTAAPHPSENTENDFGVSDAMAVLSKKLESGFGTRLVNTSSNSSLNGKMAYQKFLDAVTSY